MPSQCIRGGALWGLLATAAGALRQPSVAGVGRPPLLATASQASVVTLAEELSEVTARLPRSMGQTVAQMEAALTAYDRRNRAVFDQNANITRQIDELESDNRALQLRAASIKASKEKALAKLRQVKAMSMAIAQDAAQDALGEGAEPRGDGVQMSALTSGRAVGQTGDAVNEVSAGEDDGPGDDAADDGRGEEEDDDGGRDEDFGLSLLATGSQRGHAAAGGGSEEGLLAMLSESVAVAKVAESQGAAVASEVQQLEATSKKSPAPGATKSRGESLIQTTQKEGPAVSQPAGVLRTARKQKMPPTAWEEAPPVAEGMSPAESGEERPTLPAGPGDATQEPSLNFLEELTRTNVLVQRLESRFKTELDQKRKDRLQLVAVQRKLIEKRRALQAKHAKLMAAVARLQGASRKLQQRVSGLEQYLHGLARAQ